MQAHHNQSSHHIPTDEFEKQEKVAEFYRKKTGTEVKPVSIDESLLEYVSNREALIDLESKMHFSYDLEESMSDDERKADIFIQKLVGHLRTDTYNAVIHNYFENFASIRNSELYQILDKMPKGGLHHLHTTAAPSVDFYIQLTYNDFVYFNEREKLFKVAPKGLDEDGYIKCVDMRRFSQRAEDYDRKLRNFIRLSAEDCSSKESHHIWGDFQHKFSMINDLAKYVDFFKKLLLEILIKCKEQNIFCIELRHIFGMLFDDDRKPIGLEAELKIIQDIVTHVKQETPHFELKLIVSGLKIVGKPHIMQMIQNVIDGRQYSDLIAGFDLVNEEDFTPPILEFLHEILDGRSKDKLGLPCFFHCGETHDRENENLYDAILLKSKRIGHGFQLYLHPHLQERIKDLNICVEACPISNMLLGYVTDLRNHPVRFMLHKGIQVSINSDNPGFFGYEGVTMDYVYAIIAWDLDLRDLKKLSLNGITYSSLSEEKKTHLKQKVFPQKWHEFIKYLNETYSE